MAKKNAQRKDDSERPAERPRRSMPRWLRRAICFAGSVFLMFCAVYMFFIMVIEGYGLPSASWAPSFFLRWRYISFALV